MSGLLTMEAHRVELARGRRAARARRRAEASVVAPSACAHIHARNVAAAAIAVA